MTEHEEQAAAAERELAEMEERSARVGEHIDDARSDWEAKLADPAVPGAGGDPERREQGGEHPETNYPGKGSSEEFSEPDTGGGERERDGGDELPPPNPNETD
jgi:hypothetical protein